MGGVTKGTYAGATFEMWMHEVDRLVGRKVGLSVHDLPDQPYRDWYEDGMSTARAAAKAVKGAM